MNQAITPIRTLVVGLGATGLSCVRFLSRLGVPVAVTDSRENPPGLAALHEECLDAAVYVGGFAGTAFAAAERLVVSPGVSLDEPLIAQARQRGVEVIGDIELFARCRTSPVVAITGSNGKSTVTTMVAEMARQAGRQVAVGGNLGPPALCLLPLPGAREPDLYVLELSSFQLELTQSLDPEVATVLNLSPDHLDRHSSLQHYAAIKGRIYHTEAMAGDDQPAVVRDGHRHGIAVVNADDPATHAISTQGRLVRRFSTEFVPEDGYGLALLNEKEWLIRGQTGEKLQALNSPTRVEKEPLQSKFMSKFKIIPVSSMRLSGRHNLANALAALALGEAAGLPMSPMLEVLRQFRGLPHRTQWVAEWNGVQWFNDSKGTNVGATRAALEGMPGPLVLIAGGQGKGADFSPLLAPLERKGRAVVLIGEDAPLIGAALGDKVPWVYARGMAEAVAKAAELARPGDRVVLSPACASFDMFHDYKDRGEVYMRAVRSLGRSDIRGVQTRGGKAADSIRGSSEPPMSFHGALGVGVG